MLAAVWVTRVHTINSSYFFSCASLSCTGRYLTCAVTVLYAMAAMVLLAVVGLVWLTLAMRKQEQSKFLRASASILHVIFDVMFVMFCVSFFGKSDTYSSTSFLPSAWEHYASSGV